MISSVRTIGAVNSGNADVYAVKAEIADWSQQVLEVSCDAYGGLPPCPFARKAWADCLVTVEVANDMSEVLVNAYCNDPDTEHVVVYALIDSGGLTVEEFDKAIDEFNAKNTGLWMMGSHHDAPDNELMPDFESEAGVDYGLVLVQSLKHLVVASNKLRNTSYYENFGSEDMAYIERRKEKSICVE